VNFHRFEVNQITERRREAAADAGTVTGGVGVVVEADGAEVVHRAHVRGEIAGELILLEFEDLQFRQLSDACGHGAGEAVGIELEDPEVREVAN